MPEIQTEPAVPFEAFSPESSCWSTRNEPPNDRPASLSPVRVNLTRARLLKFFEKLSPCLVGIEACGTAHHWARELIGLGHEVRLMPPSYVKPYVKRQKNDMADAEAICEAVTRPTMRFVR